MDLTKLEKSEKIAARVYLRRRRRALEMLYMFQELKVGDYLKLDHQTVRVEEIRENSDTGLPEITYLISVQPIDTVNTNLHVFWDIAFSYNLAEAGFHSRYLDMIGAKYGGKYYCPIQHKLQVDSSAQVLYGQG